jgi:hypothetical protein
VDEPVRPELVRVLPADALRALEEARARLESPSLAARITSLLGTPIERGIELLPAGWQDTIQRATRSALERALEVALATLERPEEVVPPGPRTRLHRLAAGLSGAAGGAFGLAALPVELPLSTVVMLRSIADIARAEGEDLSSLETRLACLEVFALGGPGRSDDAAETGYFAVRAALGKAVSEAATYAAGRAATREGAPVLARLVAQIAERFGVVVGEKAAASFVPVVGALGGAAVNVVFIDHFTEVARGHFAVRRLERVHGPAAVRAAWATL